MKILRLVLGCCFALASPLAAAAVPLPFTGSLTIQISTIQPAVSATGSGVGDFAGAGGAASIPASVFSIGQTLAVSPPILVIDGIGVGAPGQGGTGNLPLIPGANKVLAFDGTIGKMALNINAYLITGLTGPTPNNAAAIPISGLGFGCLMATPFGGCGGGGGLVMGTVKVQPYKLGMVTVMGNIQGVPSTLVGTGFDNRTAGGLGVLQLVTPASVGLGPLGTIPMLGTLTLQIVPEPATAVLVAAGLAGLGTVRRRYGAR